MQQALMLVEKGRTSGSWTCQRAVKAEKTKYPSTLVSNNCHRNHILFAVIKSHVTSCHVVTADIWNNFFQIFTDTIKRSGPKLSVLIWVLLWLPQLYFWVSITIYPNSVLVLQLKLSPWWLNPTEPTKPGV